MSSTSISTRLELSAKVKPTGQAGLVFDRYEDSFKFVAIDVVADKLIVGHYTAKKGWMNDIVVSRVINAGQDYTVGVALKGPTVSVTLDGQVLLGHLFNSSTVDGNALTREEQIAKLRLIVETAREVWG